MNKSKKNKAFALKIVRLLFVVMCLGGFLYQTTEFLMLYWTYPTVVDIQQIEPSYLEMPSFSICNPIGYNFTEVCRGFEVAACLPSVVNQFSGKKFCGRFPEGCFDGQIPEDLQIVTYTKFMSETELTPADHERLRVKLEDYMECTIEFAGEERKCDLSNVLGSLYTKEDLPQYCYAIYSKWNQPEKEREFVAKGAVMHFHFVLNTTFRPDPVGSELPKPKHNIPGSPAVQIAVHSPYFLPSPYLDGMSYIGGRAYELRLKMNERHLLPPPYQTNCTDYMARWKSREGKGPINQMGIVQECRVNKTFESLGCVPTSLDYPHTFKLCKSCFPTPCNYSTFAEECGKLADTYTQPCDSISYETSREDRVITSYELIDSSFLGIKESVRKKILAYECEDNRLWTKECATIDVYILFDRFEITNLTYNPKFESLELFSVIGGYMGMWLGISLLNVYDFIGSIIVIGRTYVKKRKQITKVQKMKRDRLYTNSQPQTKYSTEYRTMMDAYQRRGMQEIW